MIKHSLSLEDRFMLHVQKSDDPNGCWEWIGAKRHNYGCFGIKCKTHSAHRISYALFVDMIPDGMEVCHICDNKTCVNPAHLFLGTHKDNMHDMISKHREDHSKNAKGEHNGRTQRKLTNEIVYQIREMIEQGYTQQEIAETFRVSAMTISYIKSKKTWKWLV